MPNFFSRVAGRPPRVSTASRNLPAIVSATVSTAGPAIYSFPPSGRPAPDAGFAGLFPTQTRILAPSLLLFPAPFAPRACFLCAQIELLDVLGMHQPLAAVVH